MRIVDLPMSKITEAPWNPNAMDRPMLERLKESINRFGVVVPLVVRPMGDDLYETVGGAQRLSVLRELGMQSAPCVVVEADDLNARLLAQVLNRVQGEDDLGVKAQLLREILQQTPDAEVLALLPETAQSLRALAALGQEDMAAYLQAYQRAQSARLKHLTFQFTPSQVEVVEEALAQVRPRARDTPGGNPNPRGNALHLLCEHYLELIRRIS